MLQHALRCVAVCVAGCGAVCGTRTAPHTATLTATHYATPQHAATRCNTLLNVKTVFWHLHTKKTQVSARFNIPYSLDWLLQIKHNPGIRVEIHCNTHWNTHFNSHCNTLQQHAPQHLNKTPVLELKSHLWEASGGNFCFSSVLQCVAVCCGVLQCVALCCSAL